MPVQPQKWHTAFRSNAGAESEGVISPDSRGVNQITALTGGGFVVTWLEADAGLAPRIRAQVYDALGRRQGAEIAVNTNTGIGPPSGSFDSDAFFDVAAQPGGGFVVAWERQANDGDIAFQRFSATGGKLGAETKVEGAFGPDREHDPSIATLSDGRFVITWSDTPGVPRVGNDGIFGSVYTAGGALFPGEDNINLTPYTSTLGGFPQGGEVVATPDGGFIFAHSTSTFTPPDTFDSGDIFYRRWVEVSAGGGPLFFLEAQTDQVSVLQPTRVQKDPAIAVLSNGGWAVAYSDEVDGFDTDLHLRVYDQLGGVVRSVTLAGTPSREARASIAAGPDGTFLVTWERWTATGVEQHPFDIDVIARLFSNTGAAIGAAFQVSGAQAGVSAAPIVTALGDGRYAIVYLHSAEVFDPVAHNFVQIVDGRSAVINGTTADNTIAGHDSGQTILNDTIRGLGGNDTLYGLAGADTVNGGLGNDRVEGGTGADRLDGGGGFDTLDYSRSAAAVAVNLPANTAAGGDAAGDLIIRFENIIGSARNDRLAGGNGVNLLNGAGGSDMLRGGPGADRFVYSAISDSALAAAGRDVIADFVNGSDRIDLAAIDANGAAAGNTAFTFIGGAAFSASGQVRVFNNGVTTFIEANTTGSVAADMRIQLTGVHVLTAGDFLL